MLEKEAGGEALPQPDLELSPVFFDDERLGLRLTGPWNARSGFCWRPAAEAAAIFPERLDVHRTHSVGLQHLQSGARCRANVLLAQSCIVIHTQHCCRTVTI